MLALPRGGVPVGYEVAQALGAPLDVVVVRKLGAPECPEYAVGAIAEGGALFVEPAALIEAGIGEGQLAEIAEREAIELTRRTRRYRGDRPFPSVKGRTVLLVDDGIATGRTARAAIRALRELAPRHLVLAAPVVAAESAPVLRAEVDDLVYVQAPQHFMAVGLWYEQFAQTTDDEVVSLLARARRVVDAGGATMPAAAGVAVGREDPPPVLVGEAAIPVPGGEIRGDLAIPAGARGIVLFAHGSGSSRFSRRNRHVAQRLRDAGLATMLLDLLTRDEGVEDEISGQLRFDIELLAGRLVAATRFAQRDERMSQLRVSYFGASTGAAAALVAAAKLPGQVAAVVSRGGRPDLAGDGALRQVTSPTLLIVGGEDRMVLELNRVALAQLAAEKKLVVVPGATHLFEEPGKLDVVAALAAGWFVEHLQGDDRSAPARGLGAS